MGIRAPRWSDEAECECLRARSISRSLSVGAMSRGEGRGEPRCFGWCAMRGRACVVPQCPVTGRSGVESRNVNVMEVDVEVERRGWNGVGVGVEELGCWLLLNVQGRGRESIPALPFQFRFNSNSKEEAKKMLQIPGSRCQHNMCWRWEGRTAQTRVCGVYYGLLREEDRARR